LGLFKTLPEAEGEAAAAALAAELPLLLLLLLLPGRFSLLWTTKGSVCAWFSVAEAAASKVFDKSEAT
jgi:hypothetical protein